MSPRRRRHRRGSRPPQCQSCQAEVLFFRDADEPSRHRIVNARPIDGRTAGATGRAYPVWGNRLWRDTDALAAELDTVRPAGTDTVDEVLDLPWHQLHACQITEAIAERQREKEEVTDA